MGINTLDLHRPAPILIFGGSYDPVHQAHVEIARFFIHTFEAQELRIIPAGQPWQKSKLVANAEQRCAMLKLAFAEIKETRIVIDLQEITRAEQNIASYSVETLRSLRAELGQEIPLILLIGADQFENLASWRNWQQLFELAHIVVAARPNYSDQAQHLDEELAQKWQQTSSNPAEMKRYSFGKTWMAKDLAWDISATKIREHLLRQDQTLAYASLIPPKVLDYIQSQGLYQAKI